MERKSSLGSGPSFQLQSKLAPSVTLSRLGWLLIVAACCIFSFLVWRGRYTNVEMCRDFVPIYAGSRCLLHGCSPYDPSALYREFVSAGGTGFNPRLWTNGVAVYPPTTFLVTLPLAPLTIGAMDWIWISLVLFSVCGTALLMADLAADFTLLPAAIPIASLLCASTVVGKLGQPAAIEIGILGASMWLVLRRKWPWLTASLLGIGFVFKPQLALALALWMFLQPGYCRRVVLRACTVAIVIISLTLVVYAARPATRTWFPQLMSSLAVVQQPHHHDSNGNETKLFNSNFIGPENPDTQSMTDVQVVAAIWSLRWANFIAAAVFLPLLAVWGWAWWRAPKTHEAALIALACLCPMTLLPIYHRQYDAILLLLCMPAVSVLWMHGKRWGISAVAVASLTALLIWDRYLNLLANHVHTNSHLVLATVLRSPVWACLFLTIFLLAALVSFRPSSQVCPGLLTDRTKIFSPNQGLASVADAGTGCAWVDVCADGCCAPVAPTAIASLCFPVGAGDGRSSACVTWLTTEGLSRSLT